MARLHNGMCLVRFAEGFSKPVTVYAHFSNDRKLAAAAMKKAIQVKDLKFAKGVYTGKITVPAKGCYFLFAEGQVNGWARCKAAIGSVKTRDTARFISRVPGMAVVRKGHLSGYYLFLEKGTFDFQFSTEMPGARLNKFYITKDPEYFLR